VKITLNGKERDVEAGRTVLEAAREAGLDIPALCAHDELAPYGSCRLCIVEATERGRKRPKIVASCLYPVKEGLEVQTETERVRRYRRLLIELMLARTPDAPAVKELAAKYRVKKPRFAALNDDCVLCGKCVRVCAEVVGANAIGFAQRGINRRVESPFGKDISRCIACGACTYVCPTGAVQMEFKRTAELRKGKGEHLCRYTVMGLIPDAVCSLNYECFRCEIDQRLRAEAGTHPVFLLARKKEAAEKAGTRKIAKKRIAKKARR